MFILIYQSSDTTVLVLELIRAATLPASFLCLVHFGARVIPLSHRRLGSFRLLTPVLAAIWFVVFMLGRRNLLMWDVWSRYLLCFPGAFLASWGLRCQLPDFRKTGFPRVVLSLKIAAVSFLCYSVIAGLVVKPADFFPASVLNYPLFEEDLGIPVQVFRTVCSVAMAFGIVRILSIFRWETRTEVRQYRDEMAKSNQMAALGTVSQTMAQQLTEPLAVARVFIERLLADGDQSIQNGGINKRLDGTLKEIERANEIIKSFYSAADITPSPTAEPIDLHQIMDRIIAVFDEDARRVGLEICAAGMDIVPCMKIPTRQLEQVFFIVIQYVIDTAKQLRPNKLLISSQAGGGQLVLRFVDNCGGIAADKVQNISKPFFKSKGQIWDSGLALAVANRIVKAYDGNIDVEAETGRGNHIRNFTARRKRLLIRFSPHFPSTQRQMNCVFVLLLNSFQTGIVNTLIWPKEFLCEFIENWLDSQAMPVWLVSSCSAVGYAGRIRTDPRGRAGCKNLRPRFWQGSSQYKSGKSAGMVVLVAVDYYRFGPVGSHLVHGLSCGVDNRLGGAYRVASESTRPAQKRMGDYRLLCGCFASGYTRTVYSSHPTTNGDLYACPVGYCCDREFGLSKAILLQLRLPRWTFAGSVCPYCAV